MYHNFLIYSSADGHLGCFHVLAIVNSAVSTGVHVSFLVLISLGYSPGVGLLDCMVVLFLVFFFFFINMFYLFAYTIRSETIDCHFPKIGKSI